TWAIELGPNQVPANALLHMPQEDEHAKRQLIDNLKQRYHNNNKQFKLTDEFNQKYRPVDAIQ
ncbi:unnamed protein product, partial [Didymodactylos carnosus]